MWKRQHKVSLKPVKKEQGIFGLGLLAFTQKPREDPTSTNSGTVGGPDRCMDGGECARTCQGSTSTKDEEKNASEDIRRLDQAEKSQKGVEEFAWKPAVSGFSTDDLHTFMWLVDFTEENHLSAEIWFKKLCYYYKEGECTGRRLLTQKELTFQ